MPFASGLDDPKGLVAFQGRLFVADKNRVWRIDGAGKAEVFAPASAFPTPPLYLERPCRRCRERHSLCH